MCSLLLPGRTPGELASAVGVGARLACMDPQDRCLGGSEGPRADSHHTKQMCGCLFEPFSLSLLLLTTATCHVFRSHRTTLNQQQAVPVCLLAVLPPVPRPVVLSVAAHLVLPVHLDAPRKRALPALLCPAEALFRAPSGESAVHRLRSTGCHQQAAAEHDAARQGERGWCRCVCWGPGGHPVWVPPAAATNDK